MVRGSLLRRHQPRFDLPVVARDFDHQECPLMDPRLSSKDDRDRAAIPSIDPEPYERHSRALYAYTAATIVVGFAALAWASVSFPIWPTISLTQAGGREGILLGMVFWIALGLLGGTRVQHLHGHGVLTFHMPFIIAATALGGPVAGGWVAMVATFEAREFREVPWYGTLANHAAIALSAVLAGIVFDLVRNGPLGTVTDQGQAAELIAIVAATFVLSGLSSALASGTVILRDRLTMREAARLYDQAYRTTSASEVILGWILVLAYGTIGWWAALVAATLVLVIWQGHDESEANRHDAMTGLLNRGAFDVRLEEILVGVRRGAGRAALLAIDLDGFKAINDTYGHATGDEVIREVGVRLRDSIRLTDAAVRRGGDEFGVLLAGISDVAAAEALATKIWTNLVQPIETDKGAVRVGASIGVVMIEPSSRVPSIDRLHAMADHQMYQVKEARSGGGVRVRQPGEPAPIQPATVVARD
jgi:diguanylate cyclase (GGDEF)-like protein